MRRFHLGLLAGLLTFLVVILLVAGFGLLPINANTSPTGWENAFSHMALNASVMRQSPRVPNPIDPTEKHLMAGVPWDKLLVPRAVGEEDLHLLQTFAENDYRDCIRTSTEFTPTAQEVGFEEISPKPVSGEVSERTTGKVAGA
jgi:hypothetical protein